MGNAIIGKLGESFKQQMEAEKAKKAEAKRLKQELMAKFKDINKNFDRKDKRDTWRFLTKHGLSSLEAKQYTTLGKELEF